MAVGLDEPDRLEAVPGIAWGTARAGLRKRGGDDLAVAELAEGAVVAAVFTRNAFAAAPVLVARRHLAMSEARILVVNAGNANAATGIQGVQDAEAVCSEAARLAECPASAVLPFSTGVIGEPLPVDAIREALPRAWAARAADGWLAAARAIMTTDTVPKGASRTLTVGGRRITVTGIAKGAGMIRPDMATMLAFVATDAALSRTQAQAMLEEAVAESFHCITVDGDTSTNDAAVLVATGASGVEIGPGDAAQRRLREAVTAVCRELAQAIVRDGEGATRFVTVEVEGGRDEAECRAVAFTVAQSPLVKTALFAGDPNWGRIVAAVGRAGLADLDPGGVDVAVNGVWVVRAGGRARDYREEDGVRAMAEPEVTIRIRLARGEARARVWTTDLSHDYVRINAEYRT
ncbi:bifunctional glutamate N-acetyltransferase/amino-acid acetyltransferase ArgJ [Inmirania thermothiophila]|uniref:Arginine biosynthesis bifunctional protein ArgJ n=1 Tax=Inmirania thermothiophila TaxID=1750597 RepID=A0A3N1XSS5_9GAMM|nr:bifunctional glutamate N-acetyltransferase/amino-acid acetyltransferase ArgJ [Inmirania thermothiophila]ROR29695.1 glutamate N-acetyltransferase [Inmirania thermothiophila]